MTEDDFILAIGRLERAVSQLEQHIQSGAGRTASDSDGNNAVEKMEYDRLRQAAEDAVSRIDRMIKTENG